MCAETNSGKSNYFLHSVLSLPGDLSLQNTEKMKAHTKGSRGRSKMYSQQA